LPEKGIGLIVGAAGAGKSFLAIDLCAAIAEGNPSWYGYKVTAPFPVVLLSLEGDEGLRARIMAWELHHGRPVAFTMVTKPFSLRSKADIEALVHCVVAAYPCGCALFVDTLNQATLGMDENTSEGMGKVIEMGGVISRHINGPVVFIHHFGKDVTRGARGHSSLGGAISMSIEVTRPETGPRKWRIGKEKDSADRSEHYFKLEIEEVDYHEDGDVITSCVAVADTGSYRKSLGKNQRIVLETATEMFQKLQTPETPISGSDSKSIPTPEILKRVSTLVTGPENKKMDRANEAFRSLLRRKLLLEHNGMVKLP
jgi:hypothetical protein